MRQTVIATIAALLLLAGCAEGPPVSSAGGNADPQPVTGAASDLTGYEIRLRLLSYYGCGSRSGPNPRRPGIQVHAQRAASRCAD